MELPSDVKMIISRLRACGHDAYAVGGCVRDSLLGIPPKDYDITTSACPDEVIATFPELAHFDTGIKHGTITLLADGTPYEVTTYRTDGDYSDHRHPDSVNFVKDLDEDLARRDLTINAMAYNDESGLCDPFGGAEDLKNGIIRAVGDPYRRFDEDALRILRALRFSSVYGFAIEKETANAAVKLAESLRNVASERIKAELDKLICGKDVGRVLRDHHTILEVIIPEIAPTVGYDQQTKHHEFDLWEHIVRTVENIAPDPVLRYAMLFHDLGKPSVRTVDSHGQCHYKGHAAASLPITQNITKRLKFDTKSAEAVAFLVSAHMDAPPQDKTHVRRMIARYGKDRTKLLFEVMRSDNLSKKSDSHNDPRIAEIDRAESLYEEVLRDNDACFLASLAIGGRDLIDIGITRGPMIGRTLNMLLEAVMDEKVDNRREDLLDLAKNSYLMKKLENKC